MSYILDALKRADADRTRGAVPGLHTQQLPSADGFAPARRHAAWPWLIAGGAVLALAGGAGWWFGAAGTTAAAPAGLQAAAAHEAQPSPARSAIAPVTTAPAIAPLPPASAPTAAPALMADASEPAPLAALPPAEVQPRPTDRASVQAPTKEVTPREPRAGQTAKRPPEAAPAPMADSPSRIPTVAELPPDIRQQLPRLTINGTRYSRNPAERMLIVQGQVFSEGGRLGPDWTLEQIGPTALVLNFRGHRYQVAR